MLTGWRAALARGCIQQRYVLSIMGFLAIANAYTMRTSLSVAITEMACPAGASGGSSGGSSNRSQPDVGLQCPADDETEASSCELAEFTWDEETQGLILSSFFWGYIVTHLPGGMLAERFGGKYSLGLGILGTAIFTLLSPTAARYGGSGWFIAVRVLMGLGEGTTFPALNALLAQWVPVSERGTLGSLVFAGSLIGNIVANAVSGVVIEATQSWDSVFYLFGGLGVLWFILWQLLCYSDPNSHPFISDEEKKYLNETIGSSVNRKKELPPIPWLHMLKSVPLWGLIFAQIGHDWGFYTMITDLPKYMKNVLRFSISANGLLSALPYLAMWLSSVGSGWVADWILVRGYMNTTNVRKVFTIVAALGPAAGIIGASYANCDRVTVVALFTVGMALMGTFYPGMKVNALDLSPNYAGTLMAFVNGAGSITGMVAPYLIGVVAYNSTLEEWRIVFWITFGILVVTGFIFVFTASGEVQYWNNLYTSRDEESATDSKDKGAVEPYEMTSAKPPAYSP